MKRDWPVSRSKKMAKCVNIHSCCEPILIIYLLLRGWLPGFVVIIGPNDSSWDLGHRVEATKLRGPGMRDLKTDQ